MAELDKIDGDLFWDDEDTETSHFDADDVLDPCGEYCVVTIQRAQTLPNIYGFQFTDSDGKTQSRYFDSEDEAENAAEQMKAGSRMDQEAK